jgi:hypothetical protein
VGADGTPFTDLSAAELRSAGAIATSVAHQAGDAPRSDSREELELSAHIETRGELIADRRAERHLSEPNVMFKFGESQSAQLHGDAQVLAAHGESRRQTYAAT